MKTIVKMKKEQSAALEQRVHQDGCGKYEHGNDHAVDGLKPWMIPHVSYTFFDFFKIAFSKNAIFFSKTSIHSKRQTCIEKQGRLRFQMARVSVFHLKSIPDKNKRI